MKKEIYFSFFSLKNENDEKKDISSKNWFLLNMKNDSNVDKNKKNVEKLELELSIHIG